MDANFNEILNICLPKVYTQTDTVTLIEVLYIISSEKSGLDNVTSVLKTKTYTVETF